MLKLIEHYWVALTLVCFALISIASLSPLPALPEIPGTDKTHHLVAYAALIFPAALRRPPGWLYLGLLFAVWSGLIELVQPHVNRYGEWLDFIANCSGLILGVVLARMIDLIAKDR
ncbi:MAG: VanZ family protein [Pseudomonadota bacterium]